VLKSTDCSAHCITSCTGFVLSVSPTIACIVYFMYFHSRSSFGTVVSLVLKSRVMSP
jgi:ABC-type sulfate transport system permease subunit